MKQPEINNPIIIPEASIITPRIDTTWLPHVQGSIVHGTIGLGLDRGLCYTIGRFVFIHVHVTITSISGSPSGNLQVTGVPFSPEYETPLTLGITSYMGVDLNEKYFFPIIWGNGIIEFLSCGIGPEQAIDISELYTSATLQFAGSYIVAEA